MTEGGCGEFDLDGVFAVLGFKTQVAGPRSSFGITPSCAEAKGSLGGGDNERRSELTCSGANDMGRVGSGDNADLTLDVNKDTGAGSIREPGLISKMAE